MSSSPVPNAGGAGGERPAQTIARITLAGFDTFYGEFHTITRAARRWFDAREWMRVHDLHRERIDLYQRHVVRTLATLRPITQAYPEDHALWRAAHTCFAELVRGRIDFEVAETFFNAITRKIFRTMGVNREIEFLGSDLDTQVGVPAPGRFRRIAGGGDPVELFASVLSHPRPALAWHDLRGDAQWLAARFAEFRERGSLHEIEHIDVLKPLFFRAREAYVVGRVLAQGQLHPLVIPVQPTASGVVVDGALFDLDSTLQVFSSTRSYFFVDVQRPADLVRFLGSLMPQLTESERYIAIAHHRHGKTLIHRELVEHLQQSDDEFAIAPGIPGLVMTVFTLPSYRNVFKIVRDRFDKPGATREAIMRSYRDVFRGRRTGRLADTQEFEHLAFARSRFSPECLAELTARAGNSVRVEGDRVVISHLYIEAKMTPLNLYLARASEDEAVGALIDYGEAIKELATNNIFAGDLLWKNFGVTHNGRLVLYDFDEICPLLDCNFRRIPPPRSHEDEFSDVPYYAVGDADVFPEEWAPFIAPRAPARLREVFMAHHGDLFDPEFWRSKQAEVVAGELHIGLPYASRHPVVPRARPAQ
ncbi:MAG: bifunctional isocitrate dehydrogenase kinase/phosphatase [Deltaproteobacteria bacterium]|nr:bifunctional isocitrate dehydrogenase kinase/phosphatase [Nannocystaceae bacterium]